MILGDSRRQQARPGGMAPSTPVAVSTMPHRINSSSFSFFFSSMYLDISPYFLLLCLLLLILLFIELTAPKFFLLLHNSPGNKTVKKFAHTIKKNHTILILKNFNTE